MHPRSIAIMRDLLLTKVLCPINNGRILDVGSYDVNGTYRHLIPPNVSYDGLDMAAGPNVNVVATSYPWPIPADTYDIVISGQTLEHVEDTHEFVREIYRVCKPGGYCILIAPWASGEHRHPVDCWRIMPDGMRFLLLYAGFSVVDIGKNEHDNILMADTWGVGHK